MKFKLQPYPHQMYALDFAKEKGNIGLLWEMGCLTGDTKVRACYNGSSKEYSLEELYEVFHRPNRDKTKWKIRAMVKDQNIGLHKFHDVLDKGLKNCITLELRDGRKITCTLDHKIWHFCKETLEPKWTEAKDLSVGEYVGVQCDKPKKKKNRYNLLRVPKQHPYAKFTRTTRSDRGGSIVEYYTYPKHRLVKEAYDNGMTVDEFRIAIADGEDLITYDPSIYAIHHKDYDHTNNKPSNLEVMTHEKHSALHSDEQFRFEVGYTDIVDIKQEGLRRVYDVCCDDPYHNFIANGIVVHNSGKTGGMINILRQLYQAEGRLLKTLIIAPPVTLYNWKDEFDIHSYIPQHYIHVLDNGTKGKIRKLENACLDKTTKMLTKPAVLLTNYESFGTAHTKQLEALLADWKPDVIILDEAHYIKNPKAKRSKTIIALGKLAKNKYILTGTPILNKVSDIFNLFLFLDNGETFGKNFHVFTATYMEDENSGWKSKPNYFPKMVSRPEMFPVLSEKVENRTHRVLTSDVLKDLPPLIKKKMMVDLSTEQAKHYKELERDFITFVDNKKKDGEPEAVVAQLAITKALRLQQLCSGFITTEEGENHVFKKNPRLDVAKELLQEIVVDNGNKCILWASFIANYDMLSDLCNSLGIKHVFITGGMDSQAKAQAVKEFNEGDAGVVIANRRAGGIGINLVAARYSIIYSRNFSLGEELQSEKRNHRGGSQIHDSIIKIDLCARDTIEEDVMAALERKEDISKRVIDVVKNRK